MTEASPTGHASMEADEEGFREDQDTDRGGNRLVLPGDGYQWKKYGQKFIKKIRKYRSYYKCQTINCRAKKRAEWSTSVPDNVRVVYEGMHTHHGSSVQSGSSQGTSNSSANQYNLVTQVFGSTSTSVWHHDN